MLHSRTLNNKINRLHERVLRIACSDYKSSSNTHFNPSYKYLSLAIEIYKFLHSFFLFIMGDIINLNRPPTYNLRTRQELYNRNPKTLSYGAETISFLALKVWVIEMSEN